MTPSPSAAFRIREATAADAAALVALPSDDPSAPSTPDEFLEKERLAQSPTHFRRRWILEDAADRVVATAVVAASPWLAKGEFALQGHVAPESRGRGYGSALLDHARAAAREQGAARLQLKLRDSASGPRVWAERRGFRLLHHKFESSLDLTAFDEAAHADAARVLDREGVVLTDLRALGDDEPNRTRLHDFFADRLTETPDMRGLPRWTRAQVREALEAEGARPEWTVIARRGDAWLGLSVLTENARGAYNFITA